MSEIRYAFASDIRCGDVVRRLPNVPGATVVDIVPGPRSITFRLSDGGRLYSAPGRRIMVEAFADEIVR